MPLSFEGRLGNTVVSQSHPAGAAQADEAPEGGRLIDMATGLDNGGYGWAVVACVFLMNAHSWGLLASFAVFFAHYIHSGMLGNISPISLAFVGGISFAVATMVCIRKMGTRSTLLMGTLIQSLGFIASSFSQTVWHLLLTHGLCFCIGLGLIVNTIIGIVPQWFQENRSFANSLAASGTGFGGLAYSLTGNALLQRLGVGWSFRTLAIVSFAVNTPCCFFIRDRNKSIGTVLVAFHAHTLKNVDFQLLLGWGFCSMFSYIILIYSLPDFAQTVGFSSDEGSLIGSMFNLSQGLGRPLIGLLSDKYGPINVASLVTLVASFSALCLWTAAGHHFSGTLIFALVGAFTGALFGMIGPVTVEVVGIKLLHAALSNIWLMFVLPALLAEPVALSIKKTRPDGYLGVQLLTGFLFAGSFAFSSA